MDLSHRPASPLTMHAWWFALAAILFAVLPPEPVWTEPGPPFLFGLLPASLPAALDSLGNICLYVPLGLALAARGISRRRAVGFAFVLSASTEALQVIIPGRDPSMSDVLANTTGAWAGAALFSKSMAPAPREWFVAVDEWMSRVLDPKQRHRGFFAFVWAALVASVFVASTRLLVPAPMPPPYLVGAADADARWSPHRVIDPSINGQTLGPGLLQDAPIIDDALHRGLAFRGTIACGALSDAVAPVFTLKGLWNTDMFTIAAAGPDLLVVDATWPRRLHLRSPAARVRGALSECAPGRKLPLEVAGPLQAPRVRVGERFFQGTTPGIASAWAFVLHSELLPPLVSTSLGLLWLAALVVPFGFWARRDAWTFAGAVLAATGAWVVPPWFETRTDLLQSIAMVAAVSAGILLRARRERRDAVTFRAATARSESS